VGKKKKMIIIISIVVVLLLAAGAASYFLFFKKGDDKEHKKEKEPVNIKEITALTYLSESEITTNLSTTNSFIVVKFGFVFESEDAKAEFEARVGEMEGITIATLNSLNKDQLQGGEGNKIVTETIKEKLNSELTHGKIEKVFTPEFKVQ